MLSTKKHKEFVLLLYSNRYGRQYGHVVKGLASELEDPRSSLDFLTNSFGQAADALVSLFSVQQAV